MKVSAWLPPWLSRQLEGRDTLRRSIDNVSWLFADQLIRMAAGLVVGVWMARYLGPEQYGWLSYATAVVATVGALASLGLNAVVVRELVREPAAADRWLGAAFFLKALGAGLGFLVCVGIAWLQPGAAAPMRPLLAIVALGLFFQALDVFDLLFQAKGAARVSAYVRIGACVLASIAKAGLILGGASVSLLAAAGVFELALAAAGWRWAAGRTGESPRRFRLDWACMRTLLREGWPLALSGLAIHTQAYADQLVIGALMGGSDLGQYAAAMRMVTAFAFVPMVVQTVAAPEITRAKQDDERLYRRRLHSFYRLMFGLFLLTAVPLGVFGPLATRVLFGAAYAGAAALLPWLAFRLFFANLGVARSVFITNEGLFRFGLVTALAGAVVNLGLNVLLVPRWGARGAIIASYVSFGLTTFALEVFQPQARANLRLMGQAIFLPWKPFAG
ncbi:MAG TPA: flippase [Lacunisphaera sp.]|nr:flippase [Lacunisphaera sp.]